MSEFEKFAKLKCLNLSRNSFANLSGDIGKLHNLQTLNVAHNLLKALPDEMRTLVKLQRLDVSHNELEGIPQCVFSLTTLSSLNLGYNRIRINTESAEAIQVGNLTKELQNLNLENNQIACLPESFCSLSRLGRLNLSGNDLLLSSFPESFSQLTHLSTLDVSHQRGGNLDHHVQLSPSICLLPALRELNTQGARITELPDVFIHVSDSLHFSRDRIDYYDELVEERKGGIATCPALKKYIRDVMDKEKIASNHLQILVLGCSEAGKTSCVRSLVSGRSECVPKDDRTFGIDKYEWTPKESKGIKIVFRDFAGQEDYHLTHQHFLTSGELALIVFDLSKYDGMECDPARMDSRAGHSGLPTGFKTNIGNWIDLTVAASIDPVIRLVGAHSDECSPEDIDQKLENIVGLIQYFENRRSHSLAIQQRKLQDCKEERTKRLEQIREDLSMCSAESRTRLLQAKKETKEQLNAISQHLERIRMILESNRHPTLPNCPSDIVCISSKTMAGIDHLKTQIVALSKRADILPGVTRKLAGTWVNLRDRIIPSICAEKTQIGEFPYISMADLVSLAGTKIKMSPESVHLAVKYLHKSGHIVSLKLPKESKDGGSQELTDIVFLDPSWLMTFFKCIINHKLPENPVFFQDHEISKIEFEQCRHSLKSIGFMRHKFLKALWLKDSTFLQSVYTREEVGALFQLLLKLMRQFQLSFPTNSRLGDDYMPWFLPEKKPAKFKFTNKLPNGRQMLAIFQFTVYLPTALFETLIVECHALANFAVDSKDFTQWRSGAYGQTTDNLHVLIVKRQTEGTIEGYEIEMRVLGRTDSLVFSLLAKLAGVLDELLRLQWPGVYCSMLISRPHAIEEQLSWERSTDYQPAEHNNWNVWGIRSDVYLSYSIYPGSGIVTDEEKWDKYLSTCFLISEFLSSIGVRCTSHDMDLDLANESIQIPAKVKKEKATVPSNILPAGHPIAATDKNTMEPSLPPRRVAAAPYRRDRVNITQHISDGITRADHVIIVCSPQTYHLFHARETSLTREEDEAVRNLDKNALAKAWLEVNTIAGDYSKYPEKYILIQLDDSESKNVPNFLKGNHRSVWISSDEMPDSVSDLEKNPPQPFLQLQKLVE